MAVLREYFLKLSKQSVFFFIGLHLNRANPSDKETSFLDLDIKVIGCNIYTSDKRDDFWFPIVNLSCLSGYIPRLTS